MKIKRLNVNSTNFLGKFLIKAVLNFSLRHFVVASFGLFFVFWGTSWTFPIVDISYSYLWLGFSILCLFFFNDHKFKKNELFIFSIIGLVITFYFIIGIPDSISSDRPNADTIYLTTYYLKYILGFLTFCAFINVFKREEDITIFLVTASLLVLPIVAFLAWKYLLVYDLDYIGVIVDDSLRGVKAFKNSLATSLALLVPFLFAAFSKGQQFRILFLIALLAILFFMYWVNSRSALIILVIEFLVFLFLSKSKSVKRGVRLGALVLLLGLVATGFSANEWIRKSGSYSDSGYKLIVTESLLQTHRGKLLIDALEGTYETAGLGNGLSTFRIRPNNEGSRTETHNDYALLLYEQGILGFGLITYLLMWRIYISIKLTRIIDNRYVEASAASLLGLFVSLMFVNIIQTSIFWALIALNYSIIKIYKKKEIR